jgi:hypothetical protein
MNGIKVYLKSGITKVYLHAQCVVGIFLVLNALREYEHVEGQKLALLLSVVAGLLLVLGWVVPRSQRRKLRFLPGTLLTLGGVALIYLTQSSMGLAYYKYNMALVILGGVICGLGLLQPLIDVKQIVYFTPEGMRYRAHYFYQIQKNWSEIKGIVFQDHGFLVEMIKGRNLKMVPYDAESQNLRVHIDKMMLVARANRNGSTPKPETDAQGAVMQQRSQSVA